MCILPLKGMMLCGGGGKRRQRPGSALKKVNQNKPSRPSHSHHLGEGESTVNLWETEVIYKVIY